MNEASFDLVRFLGSFHPLLVHLPIGFLVLAVVFEFLALLPRLRHLTTANRAVLTLAIPATAASAACGWWMAEEGGYNKELLAWHRWGGVALAALLPVLLILHWNEARRAYWVGLILASALLGATGHYGGSLTHGSDFLARHAPPQLKPWLGGKPARPRPAEPPSSTAPASSTVTTESAPAAVPADPAAAPTGAPVYESTIAPLLDTYCNACHGPEKDKGGLRLDTLEAILKGGDSGPSLVAGDASRSLLIERLRLPEDDDEHMPPEGKRQPTADEVAVLAWWIDAGGVAGRSAQDLGAPGAILEILARAPAAGSAPAPAPTP